MKSVEELYNTIAEWVDFDPEKYVNQTSIRLDSTYRAHKVLLQAHRLLSSRRPILALPILHDFVENQLSISDADIYDYEYFKSIYEKSKWLATEFKPVVDHTIETIATLDKLTMMMHWEEVFNDFDKWFRTYSIDDVTLNDLSVDNIKWNNHIYYTTELKMCYSAAQSVQQMLNDKQLNETRVLTFVRQDEVDRAFSAFYFAVITKSGIVMITDEIEWSNMNTKSSTRRPDRHRRDYYDTIYLPHAIIYEPEKFIPEESDETALSIQTNSSDNNMFIINWNQFDDCKLFMQEMIIWFIESKKYKEYKHVGFADDIAKTLLLESGPDVKSQSWFGDVPEYLTNKIIQHWTSDNSDVTDLVVNTNIDVVTSHNDWSSNMLLTPDAANKWISRITRESEIKRLSQLVEDALPRDNFVHQENKDWAQQMFNDNAKEIYDRVLSAQTLYTNRPMFKYADDSLSFEKSTTKPFLIPTKSQLVWHGKDARHAYRGLRPTLLLSANTNEWTFVDEVSTCKCCSKGRKNRATVVFSAQTSDELAWFFGVQVHELPHAWQIFLGDQYSFYFGNTILDDVDPAHRILKKFKGAIRKRSMSHTHDEKAISIELSICKICYNRFKKRAQDESIVDIDYSVIPNELTSGGVKEYNSWARKVNERIVEQHKGQDLIKYDHKLKPIYNE